MIRFIILFPTWYREQHHVLAHEIDFFFFPLSLHGLTCICGTQLMSEDKGEVYLKATEWLLPPWWHRGDPLLHSSNDWGRHGSYQPWTLLLLCQVWAHAHWSLCMAGCRNVRCPPLVKEKVPVSRLSGFENPPGNYLQNAGSPSYLYCVFVRSKLDRIRRRVSKYLICLIEGFKRL